MLSKPKKQRNGKSRRQKESDRPSFGGKIRIGVRIPWAKRGAGGRVPRPFPMADITVRQVLAGLSMATHTGLTGGSSDLFLVNTGGFGAVFNFSLADLAQSSDWTAVFDQYKIEDVEVHFMPFFPAPGITNTSTNFAHASQFVLDFDDGNALGSENAALEYDNCQSAMHYDEVVVKLHPAVAPAYYQSGAFGGYGVAPSDREWLDCGSTGILHYGIKCWIGALAASSTMVAGWNVYAQYTVSFRNTR